MLKEKLQEAFDRKRNDITTYVWKFKKTYGKDSVKQDEVKLVDCSVEELKKFYHHCETMLYNKNKYRPGRYTLLEKVNEQRNYCNAELFLRWISKEYDTPRFIYAKALNTFVSNNPAGVEYNGEVISVYDLPICNAIEGSIKVKEFNDLTIGDVIKACEDRLGFFDASHLTTNFLLKQGVYLTEEDENHREKDMSKVDYVKEVLDLFPNATVRFDSRGLSIKEMQAMLNLKNKKYSDLSKTQLELLRNKILFALERDIRKHINQWLNREEEIKKVLESKGERI